MPHSVFTGRVVEAGDPLFLQTDTDGAVALAEEEAATCPQCGMLKVWCRDPAQQFDTFEVAEEQCHAAYTLSLHQSAVADKRDEAQRAAIRPWIKFKDGKEPDLWAGLDLPGEGHEPEDEPDPEQRH